MIIAVTFLIWPIIEARAEILAIFYSIFGKFKTAHICSEIKWPLGSVHGLQMPNELYESSFYKFAQNNNPTHLFGT